MPLTIALGAATARWASPDAQWSLALLVAVILTPTDAALGQSVVTDPRVPRRVAQWIGVKSGLNDTVTFATAAADEEHNSAVVLRNGELASPQGVRPSACPIALLGKFRRALGKDAWRDLLSTPDESLLCGSGAAELLGLWNGLRRFN
jgi:hypothetical protein